MLDSLSKNMKKIMNRAIYEGSPDLRIKYKQKLLDIINDNKPPKSEAIPVKLILEHIKIDNCDNIERVLDIELTENIFYYLNRGEVRSHKPLAVDEVLKRIMNSVHSLSPINVYSIWGGNKETDSHTADYFDYCGIKTLSNLIPYVNNKAIYPLEVTILFCDNHAIEINDVDPLFVETYRKSLNELIKSSLIGANIEKVYMIETSDVMDRLEKLYKLSVKLPKYANVSSSIAIKNKELIKLLNISEGRIFPQLTYIMNSKRAEESIKNNLYIKLINDFKELGKIKAYEIVNNPELFKLFEKQVGLHSMNGHPKHVLSEYIAERFIESTLLFEWYNKSICVSFGRPDREVFFSGLPTMYIKCIKDYSNSPWFMDITNKGDYSKLKQKEKEECNKFGLDILAHVNSIKRIS